MYAERNFFFYGKYYLDHLGQMLPQIGTSLMPLITIPLNYALTTKEMSCKVMVSGKAESSLTRRWGRRDAGMAGGGGFLKRPAALVVDWPSSSLAASVDRLPGWSCWAGAPARL